MVTLFRVNFNSKVSRKRRNKRKNKNSKTNVIRYTADKTTIIISLFGRINRPAYGTYLRVKIIIKKVIPPGNIKNRLT